MSSKCIKNTFVAERDWWLKMLSYFCLTKFEIEALNVIVSECFVCYRVVA